MTHTHSASVKAAVLTGVALLLLIPLALLASLVTERTLNATQPCSRWREGG